MGDHKTVIVDGEAVLMPMTAQEIMFKKMATAGLVPGLQQPKRESAADGDGSAGDGSDGAAAGDNTRSGSTSDDVTMGQTSSAGSSSSTSSAGSSSGSGSTSSGTAAGKPDDDFYDIYG